MAVSAQQVRELREKTGAGIMDCKQALVDTSGDVEKAVEWLRKKGMSTADKKAGRIASEGLVGSYIHIGGRIGVLLEVNCETDFVARNDDFKTFVKDIAMHIAASSPAYVRREEVPEDVVAKEKEILAAQAKESGKPENVIEKMVIGRLDKYFKEICLLEQPFVRDTDKSVEVVLRELVAKIGEKVSVRRFVRYELGEGLEKRSEDFAAEVAKATATA
jgi:elongation factor Ts